MDDYKTEVIFRKEKDNDIVAIFPYMIENDKYDFACYSHVGQHSSCSYGYYKETKPVTEKEYLDLKKELELHYGYNLKVIKRINYKKVRQTIEDYWGKYI